MARPKQFDAPVAFRLPTDYKDRLEAKAERSGKPLAVYVREQMMDLLDNGHKAVTAKKRAPAKKAAPAPKPRAAAKKHPGAGRGTRATVSGG